MFLSLPKILGMFAFIWIIWMIFRFFEVRRKNTSNQSSDINDERHSNDPTEPQNKNNDASIDLQECDICGAWFSGEVCERKGCQK
mgnify:CR=1 FL=1